MITIYTNNHIKAKIKSLAGGGKFFSIQLKDGNKVTAKVSKGYNNAKNFMIIYDTATQKNKAINVSKIVSIKSGKLAYSF